MDAGADINQVSQMLNHSTVYTTSKYYGRFAQKALKQIHVKFSPGAAIAIVQVESLGEIC